MIKGESIRLFLNGVVLAASTSCQMERSVSTVEVCSPEDGAPVAYMPSTTSWGIQTSCLVATLENANRLREIWRAYQRGERAPLVVEYRTGDTVEKGTALMTSLQEQGNMMSLVKFSIQLQGSGALLPASTELQFSKVVSYTHISFDRSNNLLLSDDPDDYIEMAEVDASVDFSLDFTDVDHWFMVPGTHADWSELVERQEAQLINDSIVARGDAGKTGRIAKGRYVIYACNYESKIVCERTAEW